MLARLLRSAARQAAFKVGCPPAAAADAAFAAPLSALAQLGGWAHQQRAAFAAGRRQDDEEEEFEGGLHRGRRRLQHRPTQQALYDRLNRELTDRDADEAELARARQERIQDLIRSEGGQAGASEFVESFFSEQYRGEQFAYEQPAAASDGEGEEESLEELEALAAAGHLDEEELRELRLRQMAGMAAPQALSEREEFDLMKKLGGLRKGAQRHVLAKLLQGGMLQEDPEAMREWEELNRHLQPPEDFQMRVVDVNYTCKGTQSGGLYRYSCMVVVGNGDGVLGWGIGKAAETADAVQKAYMRACKNLFPIPRYNAHTITEPMTAKYGKVKLIMYPKAAGNGIIANTMLTDICKMAGIHDIGIKVYGSRNTRNTVKCLFDAFDRMRTTEELVQQPGKVIMTVPPGRYSKPLRVKAWARARA